MNGAFAPTRRQFALVLALGGAFVVVACALGLLVGPRGFSLDPERLSATDWSLRASRTLLGALVGGGLAATGAALQALLRNPLADPYVLGVSGGGAIAGVVAVSVGTFATGVGLQAAAGTGALLSSLLIAWFVARDERRGGESAILVGVVVNAFAWALVAVARVLLPPADTAQLALWLVGALVYPDATSLIGALVFTVAGLFFLAVAAGDLSILRLGPAEAARLGVDVTRARVLTYGAASVLVGVAVATTGIVGFVGLIVPHAVRFVVGSDDRLVIPASVALGAGGLVIFDAVARGAFSVVGTELPVGALTSLLGAPLFALVLWRRVQRGAR